jgi:hypothetical protein
MNNPEKLATFGTQRHMTNTNKNKTQHRKKMKLDGSWCIFTSTQDSEKITYLKFAKTNIMVI